MNLDRTMSFTTDELQAALKKDSEHVVSDQIGMEAEDVAIQEKIRLAMEKFGLQDASGFIYEDSNNNRHFVKIAYPSYVKVGDKICVTLFVREGTDDGYIIALGEENHNWFSKITIEKDDIVELYDDAESSRIKIINMITIIRDVFLKNMKIGDRFMTKKRDALRELGAKTPEGELIFVLTAGDSKPVQQKFVMEELQKNASAVKKFFRLTDDIGDDGEPIYEEIDFV